MKVGVILCVFIFCGIIQCREKDQEYTYNHKMPEKAMRDLLIDLTILEGTLEDVLETQKDSVKTLYMSQFLQLHKLKKEELEEILVSLKKDPKLSTYIYKAVADSIKTMENEIMTNKYSSKKDSIPK